MSIKKRKIKNKFVREVKIFLLTFLGIFLLLAIGYLAVFVFFPKKGLFISPIALSNNFQGNQTEMLLQKADIPFQSIDNASDSYSVILKDGGKVILDKNKNVQNQISSLQLILSRLTIEGKRFKSLDFRYDKPVVVF